MGNKRQDDDKKVSTLVVGMPVKNQLQGMLAVF
jgi:hypothetical protein